MNPNGETPFPYEQMAKLLASEQLTSSPAEFHGLITALVAAGLPLDDKQWLVLLQDLTNNGQPLAARAVQALTPLYQQICQQLLEEDFAFEVLLPGDDASLEERIQGLCDWAQGFLAGYGVQAVGAKVDAQLSEALEDVAEIANLSTEVDEDESTMEAAFMEVEEYLRVVAMLVYDQLGRGQQKQPRTLH